MLSIPLVTTFSGDGIKKAIKSFKQLESASDKVKFVLKAGAVAGVAAFAAIGAAAYQAGQALVGFARMAAEDEKGQKQLALAIRASTKATDAQIAATEEYIDKTQRAVGVADDQLRPALARIVRSTRDLSKAQDILNIALDVSAATGKPLAAVAEGLSRAYNGSNTALTRLGLGYDKAALKAMDFNDVQKDLEKRFSGSALDNANTFEGTMARFRITVDELKESLGQALLPYLKQLAQYGIQIADAFGAGGVAGAFAELKRILNTLIYDENGQLNAAGQQINDLINKLNTLANFVNRLTGASATIATGGLINVAQTVTGRDFTPNLPTMTPLAGSFTPLMRDPKNSEVTINVSGFAGDQTAFGQLITNMINAGKRRSGR